MLTILQGDALTQLRTLPDESVHCCVSSPPYWNLRDYGHPGQIGLEASVEEFVSKLVAVFCEVRRVLRSDGTCWVNIGDCYAGGGNGGGGSFAQDGIRAAKPGTDKNVAARKGSRGVTVKSKRMPRGAGRWGGGNAPSGGDLKPKDLVGVPWMLAFALRADGWYLRSDIIWSKPNPMPESVRDRPTKSHEYIFLFTKSQRYAYDIEAIMEPQEESERSRRLRDQERGVTTRYLQKRDLMTTQPKPGKNGCARSAEARQRLAMSGVRNKRSVWTVPTNPYPEAHFATFPPDLIKPCILAGSPGGGGGCVLDPFAGSGTTGRVAIELGRKAILIELNPKYIALIRKRCVVTPGFGI